MRAPQSHSDVGRSGGDPDILPQVIESDSDSALSRRDWIALSTGTVAIAALGLVGLSGRKKQSGVKQEQEYSSDVLEAMIDFEKTRLSLKAVEESLRRSRRLDRSEEALRADFQSLAHHGRYLCVHLQMEPNTSAKRMVPLFLDAQMLLESIVDLLPEDPSNNDVRKSVTELSELMNSLKIDAHVTGFIAEKTLDIERDDANNSYVRMRDPASSGSPLIPLKQWYEDHLPECEKNMRKEKE